jgi:probable HAF family extracellular repeat protein
MRKLVGVASFLLLLGPIATSQSYIVTDLGIHPGDDVSAGSAVNNCGQVVGFSGYRLDRGFRWSSGDGMSELPPLAGNFSDAAGINDDGAVAGFSSIDNTQTNHAVVWIDGKARDLGTLPGGTDSLANAINDRGKVAGGSNSAGSGTHAFLWSETKGMRDLGALPGGGDYSLARGINRSGHVVGESSTVGDTIHGFLWSKAHGMQDLEPLSSGHFSSASGINKRGQIVGYSDGGSRCGIFSCQRAVLWTPTGAIHGLGTLPNSYSSTAIGINNAGQVVGFALFRPSLVYHAFIWSEDEGMQDLNDLIANDSGWTLEFAFAINDRGQITGGGKLQGNEHAFLLAPRDQDAGARQASPWSPQETNKGGRKIVSLDEKCGDSVQ